MRTTSRARFSSISFDDIPPEERGELGRDAVKDRERSGPECRRVRPMSAAMRRGVGAFLLELTLRGGGCVRSTSASGASRGKSPSSMTDCGSSMFSIMTLACRRPVASSSHVARRGSPNPSA